MTAPGQRSWRRLAAGLTIGASAALIAWLAGFTALADRVEHITFDRRLARTAQPPAAQSPIVIVLIDESSVRELARLFGAWPWPRRVHAAAVTFFARAGARIVGYDILFKERDRQAVVTIGGTSMTGGESDGALLDAIRRAGNVILLGEATFEGAAGGPDRDALDVPVVPGPTYKPGDGFERRPHFSPPFSELAVAARGIGHNYLVKDADGAARRLRPFIETPGGAVASLGLAAVLAAENVGPEDVRLEGDTLRLGAHRMPLLDRAIKGVDGRLEPSRQVILNFRRPVRTPDGVQQTFPVYSFYNVLLSEDQISRGEKPELAPELFKDKIVFVGTSAAGMFDLHSMPLEGAGAPGVLLHATLADNVLSDRFMRRSPAAVDAAVTIVVALAVGLFATLLPVVWATGLTVAIMTGLAAWLTREVGGGLWIGAVRPATAAALALFGGVAWQYFVEGAEKRRIRSMFGRYVSRDVIEQLMADPARARLGGERRDMTVLFSDIRGFTAASEQGTAEDVVAQLNEYFGAMVEVLFRHQGTLDKFVGDMVMGLFGAPLDDPRHADHAVAAALEMSSTLDHLNVRWRAEGRPALDIGIGINSGEMIAGNIGSDTIMSYTVIGDAVNLGSRLESLNKEYRSRILISEATRRRLTTPVQTRLIGEVTVKGRQRPVVVYEVTGSTGSTGLAAPKPERAEAGSTGLAREK